MTEAGDSYAKVHFNSKTHVVCKLILLLGIEVTGLTAKEAPYFTLSVGDQKYSSDAHDKEDFNKGRWNVNFTW
jgi:hypothetical protein